MFPLCDGEGKLWGRFDVRTSGKRLQPLYFTKKYSLLKATFPDDCEPKPAGTEVKEGGIDAAADICYLLVRQALRAFFAAHISFITSQIWELTTYFFP